MSWFCFFMNKKIPADEVENLAIDKERWWV